MQVYATTAERTIQSAQSQMNGLFYGSLSKIKHRFSKSLDLPIYKVKKFKIFVYYLHRKGMPKSIQPVPVYPRDDISFEPSSKCSYIDNAFN